jgi:hypothetical protein
MSRRGLGLLLLLLGSLALGALGGEMSFRLFLQRVPMSVFVEYGQLERDSHFWFLAYGMIYGVVIFLWALVVLALRRVFRPGAPASERAPSTIPEV